MYYDLLVQIKNAIHARKRAVRLPFSKMDFELAKLLVREAYVKSARKRIMGKETVLEVELHASSGMQDFKVLSKPGRRIYIGYRVLRPVKYGHGIGVLSTPRGLVTIREARREKVGGEYLCQVW